MIKSWTVPKMLCRFYRQTDRHSVQKNKQTDNRKQGSKKCHLVIQDKWIFPLASTCTAFHSREIDGQQIRQAVCKVKDHLMKSANYDLSYRQAESFFGSPDRVLIILLLPLAKC